MAKSKKGPSLGSRVLNLLNPIRDPSLLVGVILTIIWEGGSKDPAYRWVLFGLLNWIAVKATIWLFVNFAFSFVYLTRKAFWVLRHPRLAWRLLDAMGTEEIIIGGLHPDMFATEDGTLHAGNLGNPALAGLPGYYANGGVPNGGMLGSQGQMDPYADQSGAYPEYAGGYEPDPRAEHVKQFLNEYSRLIGDWIGFTEDKWRAVSDSQLGWKPLKGRWNGWEEIYGDAFESRDLSADPIARRFDNAQQKGSAASAVVCFLHDLDALRQHLLVLEAGDAQAGEYVPGGYVPSQTMHQRSAKAPIIKNPRVVDAD